MRELQPNPEASYLAVRGYTNTTAGVAASGPWEAVQGNDGPMKLLDVVSRTDNFQDIPQCEWLNYSVNYYVNGGLRMAKL